MTRTAGGNVPPGLAEIPQRGEDEPHSPLLAARFGPSSAMSGTDSASGSLAISR
jgi:hypothetical protein